MSVPPLGRGPPSPPAPASVCGVEGSLPGEACGAWPCLRRLSRGETPAAGLVLAAPGEEEAGGGGVETVGTMRSARLTARDDVIGSPLALPAAAGV